MDSSSADRSNVKFLPSEIVYQILSSIENDADEDEGDVGSRQSTLYACCLVSKQWYSQAISMLYEKPYIGGSRFQQFAATISPPLGEPKSRLASLVRKLEMVRLVHQSSNSVTARLLGRVKGNLEEFTAPRSSFTEICLSPLSKCSNLRHLDLLLVSGIGPLAIRKAISRLQNLRSLRVPYGGIIEVPVGKGTSWPPLLERLDFSGCLPIFPQSITWPVGLSTLSLVGVSCAELQTNPLYDLLKSLESSSHLRRLLITESSSWLDDSRVASILLNLPHLTFLSVPGQHISDLFFDSVDLASQLSFLSSPLPLRTLEFGYSATPPLQFSLDSFLAALGGTLSNLRQVGFHEVWCNEQRIIDDEALEDVLIANAEARAKAAAKGGFLTTSKQQKRDLEPGVYYFNDF